MGGVDLDTVYLSGAVEGQVYDGPWKDIDEDVEKLNSVLKLGGDDDVSNWSTTVMYYENDWN